MKNEAYHALKRLCAKHRAFPKEKCGMPPNNKMDSILRNNFLGKGFAKPRLIFWREFEFGFRPQKGVWGMNAGGILGFFGGKILTLQRSYKPIFDQSNKIPGSSFVPTEYSSCPITCRRSVFIPCRW